MLAGNKASVALAIQPAYDGSRFGADITDDQSDGKCPDKATTIGDLESSGSDLRQRHGRVGFECEGVLD